MVENAAAITVTDDELSTNLIGKSKTRLIELETKATSKCFIRLGIIEYGNISLYITLIRFKESTYPQFLPASIFDKSGKKLWDFKEEKRKEKFAGVVRALLVPHGKTGEHVIVFENQKKIIKIIPIIDLLKKECNNFAARGISELIDMKRSLARELKMDFVLSEEEERFDQKIRIKSKKEQHKEKKEQDAILAEKEEKKKYIKKLLIRPKIEISILSGGTRKGIIMLDGEWQKLHDGIWVIEVENCGKNKIKILGSFQTGKTKGGKNERKYHELALPETFMESDIFKGPEVAVIGDLYFKINGKEEWVPLFSKNDFSKIKEAGLNIGDMIAVGWPGGEPFEVRRFKYGNYIEVGLFTPLGAGYPMPWCL